MSISTAIDSASAIFDKLHDVIVKYIPDEGTRNSIFSELDVSKTKAQFELDKLQAQMDMDASKSPSWRNNLAKLCVVAIGYHMLLHPLAMQVLIALGHPVSPFAFDLGDLNQLIYALLGLAGFETAHAGVKAYFTSQSQPTSPKKAKDDDDSSDNG